MCDTFNRLFPVWAVVVALCAYVMPEHFTVIKGAVQPLLMFIMFVMGLTLSRQDVVGIVKSPKALILGLVLHYTVMPLAALLVSRLLHLPADITIGMLLVGAVASGTASNVMTWISGGDVALAVSLAITSTVLSAILTPLIVWLLVGTEVVVPVWPMLVNIAKVVLLPVIAGGVIHQWLGQRRIVSYEPMLASAAVASILTIIAIVVASSVDRIAVLGPIVALGVILHNGIGLLGGYWGGRLLRLEISKCRALAFEVGMQNSALAVSLATQFFSTGAALPGALFSVWHNISGALLAGYWKRRRAPKEAS